LKKFITPLVFFLLTAFSINAQTRGFGNIDTADLKLSSCDFEKDANAEVLFDRAKVSFSISGELYLERHRRIKIFNEKGKGVANIKIEYDNMYGVDHIYSVEAQTINLEGGKIITDRIDPKLIYAQHTDKNKDVIALAFPNVKPGSVIEYRYRLVRSIATNFPAWYFQSEIPTRYSRFDVFFSNQLHFTALRRLSQPLLKDTVEEGGHVWVAVNLPASRTEAYMRAPGDALDHVSLLLTEVEIPGQADIKLIDNWSEEGKSLANEKNYFKELDQHLSGEDTLVKQASAFSSNDEKIAYLYNAVKNTIGWNGYDNWASKEGIKKAWKKRVGNSAEINAILYHLLRASGVNANIMLVSKRDNGLLEPDFVDPFQLNGLVTYVPADSAKYYILDATNRYYTYNQIPYDLLNSYGLRLDKEKGKYEMVFIETPVPSKEIIFIEGEISADAKMKAAGEISSYGYNRTVDVQLYKTQGEKKYQEYLTENDNNIKLSNLKLGNMGVDSLPLKQNFDFTYDLNNTDSYIMFSPNILTTLHVNPFINETRSADIDFGFLNNHMIFGRYKIPPGYTVESLPKEANIVMADKSIQFKRTLGKEDGYISVHYQIRVQRSRFRKSEYADLHEFYKRMYDMLNEQIILKKDSKSNSK
jgi:hypothetical protein